MVTWREMEKAEPRVCIEKGEGSRDGPVTSADTSVRAFVKISYVGVLRNILSMIDL